MIGFGPSQYFDAKSTGNNYNSSIDYSGLGYSGFYRLIRNGRHQDAGMTINGSYRQASGSSIKNISGTGKDAVGSGEWVRVDMGFTEMLKFGRYKGFGIGGTVYLGALVYSRGDVTYSEYDGSTYSYTTAGPNEILAPMHFGFNAEVHQMIRFSEQFRMVIGVRAGIESSEGFHLTKGTTQVSGYLGFYMFGKSKTDVIREEKAKEKEAKRERRHGHHHHHHHHGHHNAD